MLTVVYCTSRPDPKFEWFADGFARQAKDIKTELIIVDGYNGAEDRIEKYAKGRFDYTHIKPKPCVWSGEYRLTKRDYYSLSSARNTALAMARHDHVVFCDDCSVLGEDWLARHQYAAMSKIAMGGPSLKYSGLQVRDGFLISYKDRALKDSDVRLSIYTKEGIGEVYPEWLYGCNFSVPLEQAIAVNGFDEAFDGQRNGEDCDFSVRLYNAGFKIYFDPFCRIYESEEAHVRPWVVEGEEKSIDGYWANATIAQKRLLNKETQPMFNYFKLKEMREHIQRGGQFPIPIEPKADWRDGQKLSEL